MLLNLQLKVQGIMVVVAEMEKEEVEEGLEEEEHIGKMTLNLNVNCATVLATLCGSAIFDLIRFCQS